MVRQSSFLTIFLTKSLSIHDSTESIITFPTLTDCDVSINIGFCAAVVMPQPISDNVELFTSF